MGSPISRVIERFGTGVGTGSLVLAGLYQGADIQTVTVELLLVTVQVVYLEALPAVVLFTAFLLATGALLLREVWASNDDDPRITDGPPLEAIVPVYGDAETLPISVESLVESEYENLAVTVVVEPNDEPTVSVACRLAARHDRVRCRVNGRPGSKAGAINWAVAESDADHFAVFDADEWVDPAFLPRAMAELEGEGEGKDEADGGDADVFQGRRVPRATGPVETLAYCERVLFHSSYKLVELFGFANCRSSSTVFTREALERVGGFDDVLTEDLAFAHDCYRAGCSVTQARQWTNTMEAPHTLRDLWGQRKRWRVGQVEVLHRTLREALTEGIDRRGLVSIGRLTSALLGTLAVLLLAGKIALLLMLDTESALLVPVACLLALIGGVALRDVRDGRIDGLHWSACFVVFVVPAFGVLTLKAVLEYAISWNGEWYRVTKTGA
ncbi:glycosyltransferase [Natronosalvus halobius]|uniref:glycosyltransferase n=1 Tax=Natronosalvus halobius TaxID=2953746 RepID=UPI00209FAE89|nr:glycosyltransferase family 2 protein [Natronosalvus halobius]USZ70436.1 glycosyltransferase family 2 protein [Natronosalvus halobius]